MHCAAKEGHEDVVELLLEAGKPWIFVVPKSKLSIQSTLGFETLDKAAALGLETATPLTDPRQYINSNLGFRNLKI